MRRSLSLSLSLLVPALLALAALSGCGSGDRGDAAGPSVGAAGAYPLTIRSCGEEITVDAPPRRIVLIGNEEVPLLDAVGELGAVISKSGDFPTGIYGDEVDTRLAAIPTLGKGVNSRGTTQISLESIIAERPDLVLGYETTTITAAGLAAVKIPLLINPSYCSDPAHQPQEVSFDNVDDRVELYGRIFDKREEADAAIAGLKERVAAVEESAAGDGRTAAVLYVGESGGSVSAYGNRGIAAAQLKAAGLTNVFGDEDQRVFDIAPETLVAKDPDVLVLVGAGSETSKFKDDLLAVPGATSLKAVRRGAIVPLLFALTDPPSPTSILGLERIAGAVAP